MPERVRTGEESIMKIRAILLGATVLLWIGTPVQATVGNDTAVVSGAQEADPVSISNVRVNGGVVSGMIVNNSPDVVRDVKLLVRHIWLWTDERHPGEANPGHAEFYVVPGDIPPGGSLPFTVHSSPPPARSDGRFNTAVDIAEFTQIGG